MQKFIDGKYVSVDKKGNPIKEKPADGKKQQKPAVEADKNEGE